MGAEQDCVGVRLWECDRVMFSVRVGGKTSDAGVGVSVTGGSGASDEQLDSEGWDGAYTESV